MLKSISRVFIFREFLKLPICAARAALFHRLRGLILKSPHRRAAGAYEGVTESINDQPPYRRFLELYSLVVELIFALVFTFDPSTLSLG